MTAMTMLFADTWSMHGDIGTGWWVLMVIAMIVFWGAIIVLGVGALRGASRRRNQTDPTALDILDRRFAEGAITADEYRSHRQLLTDTPLTDVDMRERV